MKDLGVCEWFFFRDDEAVHSACRHMEKLGVNHLRTGNSWADMHRHDEGAHEWYDWDKLYDYISPYVGGRSIWVTETGMVSYDHATGQCRKKEQVVAIERAATTRAERCYIFRLIDLAPYLPCLKQTFGGVKEENEYHLGLVYADKKTVKPAYRVLHKILRERQEVMVV